MKYCNKCGFEKPFEEFNRKVASKDGYTSLCKTHTRENVNSWFKRNVETERVRLRQKKKEHKLKQQTLIRSLKEKPCMDCRGEFPYYCMDFDHRPEETKEFEIGRIASSNQITTEKLLREIAKCDLVCSNCHRKRTFSRSKIEVEGLELSASASQTRRSTN